MEFSRQHIGLFNRFEKTLCGMETRVDSDCIAKTFTGKLYGLFYLMNRAKSTGTLCGQMTLKSL